MVGTLVDRVIAGRSAVPTGTYRLQFSPDFSFRDAEAIVPYLRALGVGCMYASPYLRARPGSTHGYDIVDHNALNPDIGTPEEHAAMIAAAQRSGIGHLLDFVPNHMGIGPDNPWWRDVLEWGELSPYATFFDIDWRPLKRELQGKVLVPTLGDHYGRVLENGLLGVRFSSEAGEFIVEYYATRFPLALPSYAELLARAAKLGAPQLAALASRFAALRARPAEARRRRALRARGVRLKNELAATARDPAVRAAIDAALADYTVEPGAAASADRLDALLTAQHYRLAYWRVAFDEINYRRFFDINDLAGLRVEDAEVLAQTHRLIFDLIAQGKLQGLRIDHIDGLYNPAGYANLLHERAAALGQPLYLVVEKILAPFERLRSNWLVAGTTGYEFMNQVNGLFVDPRAEAGFDRIYARVAGAGTDYEAVAYDAKRRIILVNLASELTVLATELSRIAATDRRSSDFTYNGLRGALAEVVAAFPVYRTYVVSEDVDEEDRMFIEGATALAAQRSPLADESVFDFIADVLTVRTGDGQRAYERNALLRFAMRFQQYTSPVMAKSIEDTAFYRYARLISLNEVGGDPSRFGTTPAEFHAANAERAAAHPHTLLSTATHDHKRGEDVRTRIDALTESPAGWSRSLRRWARLNRTKHVVVRGFPAPSPIDEYLLYQTLIGSFPAEWSDPGEIDDAAYAAYVERIVAYLQKAMREAKVRTSWTTPDAEYEGAAETFVRAILERRDDARFPNELAAFVADIAPGAMIAGLAQVVLKFTSPGVPDVYQGCELWDHSLVDPDNRRPVDYAVRAALLEAVNADPDAARAGWIDGRVKLFVTARLFALRAERSATFAGGTYVPLAAHGPLADRIVAFARDDVVVAVPRLVRDLVVPGPAGPRLRFGEERIVLPAGGPLRYRDLFTGGIVERGSDDTLGAAAAIGPFPVAVLLPE